MPIDGVFMHFDVLMKASHIEISAFYNNDLVNSEIINEEMNDGNDFLCSTPLIVLWQDFLILAFCCCFHRLKISAAFQNRPLISLTKIQIHLTDYIGCTVDTCRIECYK